MNMIIFDKHMEKYGQNMMTSELVLPKKKSKVIVPESGIIQIPMHDFGGVFMTFCLNSLLTKSASIIALQKIREKCIELQKHNIFNQNIDKTMSMCEFM